MKKLLISGSSLLILIFLATQDRRIYEKREPLRFIINAVALIKLGVLWAPFQIEILLKFRKVIKLSFLC